MGSQQIDDDNNVLYGGVLFTYDQTNIDVYVPHRDENYATGKAINTGKI